MTMLEFHEKQRAVLADKLPDLANLAAGAMIFGQALSGNGFSFSTAVVGFGIWLVLVILAIVFAKGSGS